MIIVVVFILFLRYCCCKACIPQFCLHDQIEIEEIFCIQLLGRGVWGGTLSLNKGSISVLHCQLLQHLTEGGGLAYFKNNILYHQPTPEIFLIFLCIYGVSGHFHCNACPIQSPKAGKMQKGDLEGEGDETLKGNYIR